MTFNSQSTRIVLLLNDQHHKFWDNTKTVLKDVMGPDRDFTPTEQRIDGFKHAYGTILYFEDEDVIKGLQEQMPNYVITLLIGQFKQTQCINLQFGLH